MDADERGDEPGRVPVSEADIVDRAEARAANERRLAELEAAKARDDEALVAAGEPRHRQVHQRAAEVHRAAERVHRRAAELQDVHASEHRNRALGRPPR